MTPPIELHIDKATLLKQIEFITKDEEFVAILDSCSMDSACNLKKYELLIGWGCKSVFEAKSEAVFSEFKDWRKQHNDWTLGVFSYELKNNIELLSSKGPDYIKMPAIAFFVPEHVITIDEIGKCELYSNSITGINYNSEQEQKEPKALFKKKVKIKSRTAKPSYIADIKKIKDSIANGDVYELNYCQEFYCQPANLLKPYGLYQALIESNPSPFSAYLKFKHNYIISSSPERFLMHQDSHLVSQPIKGTAKRQINQEDEKDKINLLNSEKDRAENVMIVDLVRNDLSRSCLPGTVKVKELFGIYTYPFVHQMISTVQGQKKTDIDAIDALKFCFPMGSMTGAPKIAAMKIIDSLESSSRGWYSGALGYIEPNGNFDFNVAIRSYFYNQQLDYLSIWAGGAITFDSDAESEYEESLLKANALLELLQKESIPD